MKTVAVRILAIFVALRCPIAGTVLGTGYQVAALEGAGGALSPLALN